MSDKAVDTRKNLSFFRTFLPLTSRWVRILLSDPDTSHELAKVIREKRHSKLSKEGSAKLVVSDDIMKQIAE